MVDRYSQIKISAKVKKRNSSERIAWHPAFYGGIELDFKADEKLLTFESEFNLSKEPLRIDVLIIKKKSDEEPKNQIGKIFRKYNIVEYKSPRDNLSIDDYFKAVGYAFIYKGLGKSVDQIPFNELTVTLLRYSYPRDLIKMLRAQGARVEEAYPGIYYVSGLVEIPTQIVVTKRFEADEHVALKLLSPEVTEDDVRRFLDVSENFTGQGDRHNANAVLQASTNANRALYKRIWRDDTMCQALMEIMKEEVDRRCDVASDNTTRNNVTALMETMHLSADEAMDALKIPADKRAVIMAK